MSRRGNNFTNEKMVDLRTESIASIRLVTDGRNSRTILNFV